MVERTNKRNVKMNIDGLKDSFQYGMHGCGSYKGTKHVNTLEALRYWRRRGVKVMEIDMAKTYDGGFVALAHLMNKHYLNLVEIDILDNPEELTENWFMSQKLCKRTNRGGLTPMNLSMIVDLMRDDPELIVMFDLWRMWDSKDTRDFSMCFSKLASEDIKKRCVIEVYNKNMLAGIRETESDLKVMYCVHGPQDPEFDENVSPDILKRLGINIISYPWLSAQEHPGELESYHNAGFIIFSLYKDNRYSKQMKSSGVNVNLVDNKYHIILLLLYWLKQRIRRGIMK